jgi:CheY-like chemotaxis protein
MEDERLSPGTSYRRRLLVVDDNAQIRYCLSDLGEELGLDVATAEDGEEALLVFSKFEPDIVILDIYMPRMNGILAMHKMKEIDPNCPIILITGFGHYQQLIQNKKVQPDGFILKPFQIQIISNQMLKLLDKREEILRYKNEETPKILG